MLDLEALLDPISDTEPSGQDLEYDDDFIALEMANKPGEERVIGDSVIPAEDPDYGDVKERAEALLTRTRDLRVAVILANSVLHTDGLGAFGAVLRYVHQSLEDHWDSVHPQLDEEDSDPTMRVNAVLGLTGHATILKSLRTATLIDSRAFGRFSLRDLQIAAGEVNSSDEAASGADAQTIAAAFQDIDADALTELVTAATSLVEDIRGISGIFDARIGALGPDLDPLLRMALDIRKRLAAETDQQADSREDDGLLDGEDDMDLGREPASAERPRAAAPGGDISTPAEVKDALDRIIAYYARVEPSSPLPILLRRAKRLVSADFVTIMRDMAPEGVGNVALIGGFEPDEGDEGTHQYD